MITLTELLSLLSLSATVPMLMTIKKRHLVVCDDDSKVTKTIKSTLSEEMDRRWELKELELVRSIYISAVVLDPRFKKLSFFSDEQRDEAYSAVEELADSLADRSFQQESDMVEEPGPTAPTQQRDTVMAMLLASDEEEEQADDDEKSEMKTYLKDFIKCTGGPLKCW